MKLFEHKGNNVFKLIEESDLTSELKSLNIKYFSVYELDSDESTQTRPIVSLPVKNNVNIAFYRSFEGSSSKQKGNWYPVFGLGKEDWFIKGNTASGNEGYGVPEIKQKMDKLNSLFQNLEPNKIISILTQNYGKPIPSSTLMENTYGELGIKPNLNSGAILDVFNHIEKILEKLNPSPTFWNKIKNYFKNKIP